MADITFPKTFQDGPGNIASGVEVMANFNALKAVVENLDADNLSALLQRQLAQPGDLKLSARTTDDGSDWLVCDGRAVSRATYAALFAVAGTKFGAGDGSTTFNLPDMRGRVPVGPNAANAALTTVGQNDGIAYGNSRSPSHGHNVGAHTHGVGTLTLGTENSFHVHNPNVMQLGIGGSNSGYWCASNAAGLSYAVQMGGASNVIENTPHSHAISGRVGSGGGADGDLAQATTSNSPAYMVVSYLVKT